MIGGAIKLPGKLLQQTYTIYTTLPAKPNVLQESSMPRCTETHLAAPLVACSLSGAAFVVAALQSAAAQQKGLDPTITTGSA